MTNTKRRIEHVQRELEVNALTCRCLLRDLVRELKEGSRDTQQEVLQEAEQALKVWTSLSEQSINAWNDYATETLRPVNNGGAS